ncbi:MMPL family transporter [Streptomyces stramineus]
MIAGWILAATALTLWTPEPTPHSGGSGILPSHYESARADRLHEKVFPSIRQPAATAVFQRKDGDRLTPGDERDIAHVATGLSDRHHPGIAAVTTSPEGVSPNGRIALAQVHTTTDDPSAETVGRSVKLLRQDAKALLRDTDLRMGVTGRAAIDLDAREASAKSDGLVMKATLVLIVVLLLLIFRSPLIAALPALIIGITYMVAVGLIAITTSVSGLNADAFVSAMLIVVLFGIGTDYILFLLFRYREELRAGAEPKEALIDSVARVGETLASAASVVIVAFLALLLSSVGTLRTMGPPLAISVAVALVAALTLVPAVFSLLGTKAFWPSASWAWQPRNPVARGIGAAVARRPGLLAGAAATVLALLTINAFDFTSDFETSSQSQKVESIRAAKDLERGFPASQSDPVKVYLSTKDGSPLHLAPVSAYGRELGELPGVGTVSPPVLNEEGSVALYKVALTHRPAAAEAVELAGGMLRDRAHEGAPAGTRALVGGTSAAYADMQKAVVRDYTIVFSVAALAIMIILGLLLRSLLAPFCLMIAVALGCAASLGSVVWLVQGVQHQPGLSLVLPAILYLFVVTLGTDYNILMVTRLREELARGVPLRRAVRAAVAFSAPTIAAAALILVSTFGVLALTDSSMLRQVGAAVAFGTLLSAFVLAMFLVPALMHLMGRWAWWPGRLYAGPAVPPTLSPDGPGPAPVQCVPPTGDA